MPCATAVILETCAGNWSSEWGSASSIIPANRRKPARAGAWSESMVLFEEKFSGGPLFLYFGGMRPARLCNKLYKKNAIVTRCFLIKIYRSSLTVIG